MICTSSYIQSLVTMARYFRIKIMILESMCMSFFMGGEPTVG